ncbi:MAG TPA: protoporphyrinogen oxidase HemJ [Pseudolabrys sp.]|nr:protoporphyrinogen oxidase HemJ [Pseudolabrys sp.]
MTAVYLWLKALHIIAVIAWMAGLLYLPRLFVYHTIAKSGSELSETFKTMERRLLTFIMLPAMIVTWIVGIVLLLQGQWLGTGWLHAKLVAVVAMTILHGLFAHWVNEFRFDRNRHSQKFYRIVNEIPTVLLIVIVVLAAVKPF